MNIHCFYHSADLDGHCSGAIVRHWCCLNRQHTFIPHPVNYGDGTDWFCGTGSNSMAVIVDFTPPVDYPADVLHTMSKLYAGGLIWIDHHQTALDKVGPINIRGARGIGTAACELTWMHLFPARPVPQAVRLLGRYDVFDRTAFDWHTQILPFQYGMRLDDATRPDADTRKLQVWDYLLNEPAETIIDRIIGRGNTCLTFELQNNRRTARAQAYDCEFCGLRCVAANARGNSLVLDAAARPEHQMRVLWGFVRGKWLVSLYENGHDDIDCGAIAAEYGGGGHKGAAGFSLPHDLSPLTLFPYVASGPEKVQ